MTTHPDSMDPVAHLDLAAEERAAEASGRDLHGFLAEGIDKLLEEGLPAALDLAADRLPDLALEPGWGAVRSVARMKSAMQTAL